MSCGCSKGGKTPSVPGASFSGKTFLAKGETIECFSKRTGITDPVVTGPVADDKIKNTSITPDCDLKISEQFALTKDPAVNYTDITWTVELKDEKGVVVNLPDIGLTFTNGKLEGTVKKAFEGKAIKATVIASGNPKPPVPPLAAITDHEIDNRTYAFAAAKCDKDALRLTHPMPNTIKMTGKFGEPRKRPPGQDQFHKGIDFAAGGKGKIVSAADGEVIRVVTDGTSSGYGNVIYISHKNSSGKLLGITRYGHISAAFVKVGDKVAAGQLIANEGSVGHSSGPHLHFELRLPSGEATDPLPYINGKILVATNPNLDNPGDTSGGTATAAPAGNKTNTALTSAQINAKTKCGNGAPVGADPDFKNSPGGKSSDSQYFHSNAPCRPSGAAGQPNKSSVIADINSVLDQHPELNAEDRQYFISLTKIESSYDPFAKAGTTTATGPYQMIKSTASHYYAKAGIAPSCENRCDVKKATEAMIILYKEQLKIYTKFKSTGTVLGRVPPSNAHTARYNTMSKGGFIYMLHHDGEGSVQRGNNLQGYDYWRSHSPTA